MTAAERGALCGISHPLGSCILTHAKTITVISRQSVTIEEEDWDGGGAQQ